MSGPLSYIVCATPRTGSTLLCDLLTLTGVAGRPESYFREPDRRRWADVFGVAYDDNGVVEYRAFAAGALTTGTTPNGVFAARVMWGNLPGMMRGLDPHSQRASDLDALQDAFGELRFLHLRRRDVVGQAVSWARAEQTAYWQYGDTAQGEPRLDLHQIDRLVRQIEEDNDAWESWFTAQKVDPFSVEYESVSSDPNKTVRAVLSWIGVTPPAEWVPVSPHERQADGLNADWARRYRDSKA